MNNEENNKIIIQEPQESENLRGRPGWQEEKIKRALQGTKIENWITLKQLSEIIKVPKPTLSYHIHYPYMADLLEIERIQTGKKQLIRVKSKSVV